jgi:hypothetical protein
LEDYAAATGTVTIPYIGNKPTDVALGGGILALILTTVMAWIVVSKDCAQSERFAECKVSLPHTHIGCVRVIGLRPPPEGRGALSVRAGPELVCELKDVLVNDDIAEVMATRKEWNYVRKLSGNSRSHPIEGWVSISFIAPTPCPKE